MRCRPVFSSRPCHLHRADAGAKMEKMEIEKRANRVNVNLLRANASDESHEVQQADRRVECWRKQSYVDGPVRVVTIQTSAETRLISVPLAIPWRGSDGAGCACQKGSAVVLFLVPVQVQVQVHDGPRLPRLSRLRRQRKGALIGHLIC